MIRKLFYLCYLILFTTLSLAQENLSGILPSDFILPKPSGKYSVGRTWSSVKDSLQAREIPLFIYYPVTSVSKSEAIIPTEKWRNQYLPVLQKKLGDSAGNAIAFAKANFVMKASGITSTQKFPLILFSPGMGWSTLEYSYIIHEIVSAGYIVVAINSPSLAPVLQTPSGTFVKSDTPADRYQQTAEDIGLVLQELKRPGKDLKWITKNIDLNNIAAIGHSLGGAGSLLAAHIYPGIKAVVNMDGDIMASSLTATPRSAVLFLNQMPAGFETRPFADMQKDTSIGWRYQQMTKASALSPAGTYVSIAGIYHSNFQDYALLPPILIPDNIRKWRLGPIDGRRGLNLITQILITYVDKELKNNLTPLKQLEQLHSSIRVIDVR